MGNEAIEGLRLAINIADEGLDEVLYVAVRQSLRLIQKHLREILGDRTSWPVSVRIMDHWPGMEAMDRFFEAYPMVRWLIMDIEPRRKEKREIEQLALRHAVSLRMMDARKPVVKSEAWKRERAQRFLAAHRAATDHAERESAAIRVVNEMRFWSPPPGDDELARLSSRDVGTRVYFIQGEDGGNIKIGYARDVASRLATLQPGSPVALRVIATQQGGQPLESALHRRFAAHRLHGEWFAPAPELLAYVEGLP